MKKLADIVNSVYSRFNVIAGLALLAMILVTLLDVIFRATGFNGGSLRGAMEINICMMAVLIFLGFGKCVMDDGFIRVEIFNFRKAEKPVRCFIDVIHAALCLIIAWNCFIQGISAQSMHGVSQLLKIPKYPFMYLSAFAFLFIAIAIPMYNIRSRALQSKIEEEAPALNDAEERGEDQ